MRKYLQRDLSKYVDYSKIDELKRARLTQKAERSLQSILVDLLNRLEKADSETREKDCRMQTLEEVLEKYRRQVARDEETLRNRQSLRKRVMELRRKGMSQRNIAELTGVSQQRVQQILKKGDNPLVGLPDKPDIISRLLCQKGLVSKDDRDRKILRWREMGYPQRVIAWGVGLSRSRVSQIVLAQCTQVQKINIKNQKKLSGKEKIHERAQRNNFHRNTQRKIEQIRKVAPGLAERCETREVSVRSAYNKAWDELVRLGVIRPRQE